MSLKAQMPVEPLGELPERRCGGRGQPLGQQRARLGQQRFELRAIVEKEARDRMLAAAHDAPLIVGERSTRAARHERATAHHRAASNERTDTVSVIGIGSPPLLSAHIVPGYPRAAPAGGAQLATGALSEIAQAAPSWPGATQSLRALVICGRADRVVLGETLLLRAAMASIVFGGVVAIWPRSLGASGATVQCSRYSCCFRRRDRTDGARRASP